MTLIELSVVLLILIGLAGMLLPYVGGFADKTHDSANSTSEHELAAAISRYDTQYMAYPNMMDSLISDSAGTPAIINFTIANRMGMSAATYGMKIRTLSAVAPGTAGTDAAFCGSLRKAGMTLFAGMDSAAVPTATPVVGTNLTTAFQPTFNYYDGTTIDFGTSGTCSGSLAELTNDDKIAQALGWSVSQVAAKRALGHTFVAVGMGTASTASGRTIQEAPVHFAKTGNANAANAYNRLLVIFEVDGNDTANCGGYTAGNAGVDNCGGADGSRTASGAFRAQMAGTAMAMHDLLGVSSSLAGFYQGTQN